MTISIGDIEVDIFLKKIKNMHLYVKPADGRVSVSAPLNTKVESIALFVRKNYAWVMKHREAIQNQLRESPRRYVNGETHYLWGEQYFLTVKMSGTRSWGEISFSGNEMTLVVPKTSTDKSRHAYVTDWYRQILNREIAERLPYWERITGLKSRDYVIQKMVRSWGTCNSKKGLIRLNLQLVKKPKVALDYVIIHELCHLKVQNHGKKFVALLDRFFPNWREVRKRLNATLIDVA